MPGAKTVQADDKPVSQSAVFNMHSWNLRLRKQKATQGCIKLERKVTQCALQGVPVYGITDSGADITIIGGQLLKRVALAAHLKKKDFLKP